MSVDKATVIIILAFIGLIIIIFLVFYYYRIAVKRVNLLNITERGREILSVVAPLFVYLRNAKNKKSNTFSFLIFLILAIIVIIAIIVLYYLIYRGAISFGIENTTEEVINKVR